MFYLKTHSTHFIYSYMYFMKEKNCVMKHSTAPLLKAAQGSTCLNKPLLLWFRGKRHNRLLWLLCNLYYQSIQCDIQTRNHKARFIKSGNQSR